ncbi:MAG TPA: LON peptidase substrate-binding domain-containing protein [Candidatus Binataceae bacterium]|nr:LON peptidase substrate-binding domain-containing protein [Candidatus Binataceae bacterium]
MADLPEIIPIFPLPDFVLFPRVHVPLHIFEPRYRQMVADVIERHGVIGMVMLKGEWESDYHAFPDIFEIGCAGKIGAINRLPDGRFNLTLEGLSEFRVTHEVRERVYRQARIEWCPAPSDQLNLDAAAMANLRELLISFLGPPALDVWRSLVEERGLRGADLINLISFHLDIPAIEKQTLLEARGGRAACLLDVITFKLEERKLGPGGSAGPSGLVQ